MAALNYYGIWRLILQNKFVFESDEDLTCGICKELLKDACQSYCGCQFCYNCIHSFAGNENKFCPGNNKHCNDEFILLDVNVLRSPMLNKKVSTLKVKCPNQFCGYNIQLIDMENHMRLCTKQHMVCPFVEFGCTMKPSNLDNVVTHLHNDILKHTGMHTELIQSMKNEINLLKENFAFCNLENISLRNELAEVRSEIQVKVNEVTVDIRRNAAEQIAEIIRLKTVVDDHKREIKDNWTDSESRIVSFRVEMERNYETIAENLKEVTKEAIANRSIVVDDLTKDVRESFENNNFEIVTLKEQLAENENRIAKWEGRLREMRREMGTRMIEERNVREKEINEQRKQLEDVRIEADNVAKTVHVVMDDIKTMKEERIVEDRDRDTRMNRWIKLNKLCPNIDATYAWKFDQISRKRDTQMFSHAFYSNNYKLCLSMLVYSNGSISLYCYIMRGEYDDKLVWPMKRGVTLSINNINTAESHKSETYQTVFHKPTRDRCALVGGFIINYSSIKDDPCIIANDSIIVSCIVSD